MTKKNEIALASMVSNTNKWLVTDVNLPGIEFQVKGFRTNDCSVRMMEHGKQKVGLTQVANKKLLSWMLSNALLRAGKRLDVLTSLMRETVLTVKKQSERLIDWRTEFIAVSGEDVEDATPEGLRRFIEAMKNEARNNQSNQRPWYDIVNASIDEINKQLERFGYGFRFGTMLRAGTVTVECWNYDKGGPGYPEGSFRMKSFEDVPRMVANMAGAVLRKSVIAVPKFKPRPENIDMKESNRRENEAKLAFVAMVDKCNRDVMTDAAESGELPDGGWKIMKHIGTSFIIMRRDDGVKFRVTIEEISWNETEPNVSAPPAPRIVGS